MDRGIISYIPQLLLDWYRDHGHGEIHRLSSHDGILLFVDTSGFTALTRILAGQGKIGFEILTNLLNALFASLEQIAIAHQGDILKFSGDAIWCYFPHDTRLAQVYAEMLYQIARLNEEQSICRDFPLSLHAGASVGQFELVTLGGETGRIEFEIIGRTVIDAYFACDAATAGELALTTKLLKLLPSCQTIRQHQEYHVIKHFPSEPRSLKYPALDADELTPSAYHVIERYLPDIVRTRKLDSNSLTGLQSEHRQVAVLFANLTFDYDLPNRDASDSINRSVSRIFEVIREFGGIVARIDPFGKGHKLLALFGALKKSSSDNLNALRAADRISQLNPSGFKICAGLSSGPLLCGEVGSTQRKEYTVMGEAVNMAARLMSKADPKNILMDEPFYEVLHTLCDCSQRRLQLKGVGDAVPIYQFVAWKESGSELSTATGFVGREGYLQKLRELWQEAEGGVMMSAVISGETGVGKTALASTFVAQLPGAKTIYLSGFGGELHHPGWIIREWLKRAYLPSGSSMTASSDAVEVIRSKVDERWLPIIDQILFGTSSDNEWTRGLTTELRFDKLIDVIKSLLTEKLSGCLTIFDDLETIDSFSRAILQRLLVDPLESDAMMILIGSKADWLPAGADCTLLTIFGFTADEMSLWFNSRFVSGIREKEFASRLALASEGNPLFMIETVNQLAAANTLGHLTSPTKLEVLKPLTEIKLANRIEDLQLAQFDALPESHRQMLKIASVVGSGFAPEMLQHLSDYIEQQSVETGVTELVKRNWLVRNLEANTYDFKSNHSREAIYRCIPVLDLQHLHRRVGETLLSGGQAEDIFALAHHFSRSDNVQRAFSFSLKAAVEARARNLLVEAAQYFQECGKIIESAPGKVIDSRLQLEFCSAVSEFAILEGDYVNAYHWVRYWRQLARSLSSWDQYHAAANQYIRILWKQSKYHRCRQALSRLDTIDEAKTDLSLLADSYSLLGELHRRTGRLAEAQAAGRKAVELAHQTVNRRQEAVATNNLGLACWSAGELDVARDHFRSSLKLRDESNSKYTEATVANNLAIIAEEMGDYIEARRLAERAVEIFSSIGDRRNQSYSSGNLANLLVYAGRYRQAIELYAAADQVFLKSGETHPHYYTVGNLGDLDLILGSLDDAHSKYKEVERFAIDSGDLELAAETTTRLAEHAYFSGDLDRAKTYYLEAIDKAKEVGSLEYQVRSTIGLTRYLIGQRNPIEAEKCIQELERFVEATNSDRTRFETEFLSGELMRIQGRVPDSRKRYRECSVYALRQQQFELALKSNVRIYETDQQLSQDALEHLRSLLADFVTLNGEGILSRLLSSNYFQYFRATLETATAAKVTTAR